MHYEPYVTVVDSECSILVNFWCLPCITKFDVISHSALSDDDTSVSGLLQSRHHIWFGTGMLHVTLLGTRGCSFLIFNDDIYFTVLEDGTASASPRATSQATCTSSEGE